MLRVVMTLTFISAAMAVTCEEARMKCSFRTGCAKALEGYVLNCGAILQERPPDYCPEECQNALVALTSTIEGTDLMMCSCNNEVCSETRQRMEICRPQVMRAMQSDTIVACDTAQWICAGDATCSKALEYYNKFCQTMFKGKRCSFRCKNSIAILKKQEKAAKLDSCQCSGREEFDCPTIRMNMARLCFNQTIEVPQIVVVDHNDISGQTTYAGDKTFDVDIGDSAVSQLPYLTWTVISLIANMFLHRYLLLS